MHTIITIDGTAASGKGTLAKALAKKFDGAYMDTGLLYRAVGINSETAEQAIKNAHAFAQNFDVTDLDNPSLRSEKASQGASIAAAIPEVRQALLKLQKDFAYTKPLNKKCVVLDGRDTGTVIAPDAHIKFFVDAKVEERAKRRTKELQSNDKSDSYEAVLEAMRQRDARDISRKTAPTLPAPDALVLDTTHMGVDIMVDKAVEHIKSIAPDL